MNPFTFDRYVTIPQVTLREMESKQDPHYTPRGENLKQAPRIGQQMDTDHAPLHGRELKQDPRHTPCGEP